MLAAMGSMAEFPELITSMFLSGQEISESGIYNIRFFIRGKPWVVTVDDYLLTNTNGKPIFAKSGNTNAMWPAILEKAWAKIVGNYEISDGGYMETSLRALTGVPVFTYKCGYIDNNADSEELWTTFKAADDIDYLLSTIVYYTGTGLTN